MVDGQRARSADHVQSLERGLSVIRAFDAEHPELTLSEVARATGLTRAAARRFLLTLVELGYMRTDGRLFALRPRILELGYAYLSSLTLPEVAQPHLEALVARVRESSSVSVLDGEDVVYVARVPTKRIMAVAISVVTGGLALAAHFGDGVLRPHDVAAGILGAVVKDPGTDRLVWSEYLETVARERDGWADFYRACREISG